MSGDLVPLEIPDNIRPTHYSVLTGGRQPRTENANERIAALSEELATCQRLAILGNIAAVVAHEFNNLMTAVLARSHDALTRDDVPAMRKALDCTVKNTQKAIDITHHLLRFGGASRLTVESCSVAACFEEALATATRPFDKDGIQVRQSIPPGICVRAHRILFEQVLLNLLLNARNAIGRRGSISVSAEQAGDDVIITVTDSGKGFTAEELDSQVNPYLAAAPGERTAWHPSGFGLQACRLIAHQHDARIEASAAEPHGCTFRIYWPAAAALS